MNSLTQTLLAGAALCALGAAPAIAQQNHPRFHFTALHGGRVVNKTKMYNQDATYVTYTFGVYTSVSFSRGYGHRVHLAGTFYVWSSSSICHLNRTKFRVDHKKTEYGKASVGTETYSFGCPSGPTSLNGMNYKITDPNAEGHTDHAAITYKTTFVDNGTKYKAKINLDVSIDILKE